MDNALLAQRGLSQPEQDRQERTITYPRASVLFSANTTVPKRVAILSAVTRLAAVTKAVADEGVLDIYADTLEDIDGASLARVFDRAERTCKFLPTPAELREMAGLWDGAEIDKAWLWVQNYLIKHGSEGRGYLQENLTREAQKACEICQGTGFTEVEQPVEGVRFSCVVTRCSCRKGEQVPAPMLPPRIFYALQALANSAREALEMIFTAEVKYQGKIRAQFDAAYKRAQIMQEQA